LLNIEEKIFKHITIEDNATAIALFGETGENLKRLEKKLGVKLDTRGNLIVVHGEGEKVQLAERLVNELAELLKRGYALHPTDIDYAIRAIETDREVHLADIFTDTVYISFKKKVISP